MKPDNALTFSVSADLSGVSMDEALIKLGCFPLCTLRVSSANVSDAYRVVGLSIPRGYSEAVISPRVNIVIDPTYKYAEWSIEYEGKIFWSPGA